MNFIRMLAALWCAISVSLFLASLLAALLHPALTRRRLGSRLHRPVSAIVPVKYLHDAFEVDQASLFAQDYPELEVLLTAAEHEPDTLDAVRRVQQRFPAVESHFLQSEMTAAASPKLNNMWAAIGEARNDLILTKDSNIHLEPGDVENLMRYSGPDVGLVGMIPIVRAPGNLPAWIEAAIINGTYGRVLMLASLLGIGVNPGKIMLFSRAGLEKAGGLEGLAWAVGEDAAITAAFAAHGLKTLLSDRTATQWLGPRALSEIWHRHVRWMVIWRFQAPAVFVGSFFANALSTAMAAAIAAPRFGLAPSVAALVLLGCWFLAESLLCLSKGWPFSFWSLPAFLGREIVSLTVWLRALTTRDVFWGGGVRRVSAKAASPAPNP